MKRTINVKKFILTKLTMLSLLFSSCQQEVTTGKRSSPFNPFNLSSDNSNSNTSGNTGAPTDNGISNDDDTLEPKPKVEIRNFVNPRTGAFVEKLTVPKNFSGMLYLSGLNITSLSDRHVKVHFYFGHEREKVEVPAVVARAPGITPTTDIEVLILNMNSKPFENIRLLYDLYDYNTYDFDQKDPSDGSFISAEISDEPVTDQYNKNLYCRGLILDDDPTFQGTNANCSGSNQMCLYSYAKVKDRGLHKMDPEFEAGIPLFPNMAQIDQEALGYYSDNSSYLLNRCLPDNPRFDDTGTPSADGVFVKISESISFDSLGASITGPDEIDYLFMGPYQSTNKSLWQISGLAAIGPYGIFRDTLDNSGDVPMEDFGIESNLFPRFIKKNLAANIEHLSSERPNGFKEVLPFPASGSTVWMDGCNERVTTKNSQQEHIGSCSVTAIIEIEATDPVTGAKEIVAGRGDGGIEVKLQLTKSSTTNNTGSDVLYANLNSCQNSNGCGAEECCYNNKCWSKKLVSSCLEDSGSTGNLGIGATCTTDYQCSSLCCNKSTGTCAVHDTTQDPPVLCSKPAGQQCISKEFCAQSVVQECYIVKTGTDNTGATTCALICYNRLKFGDCLNGLCVPPLQPTVPVFNPADPNRCDSAIDPPSE